MADFKIPSFFILFLTFLFLWVYNSRKRQKKYEAEREAFWSAEQASLVVRKKEIPAELFFRPDISQFQFPSLPSGDSGEEKYSKLKKQLGDSVHLPMLNLNDLSNTEIRLSFGTANQTFITQAEENYSAFLTFLYDYALLMKEHEFSHEAILALEEAVRLRSDISKHYMLLGDLYMADNNPFGVQKLLILANDLTAPSKNKIISYLNQLLT